MPRRSILLIATLIAVLDQLTKSWVRDNFAVGESTDLVPELFAISHVTNTGIAFSLFEQNPQLLTIVISIVMLFILVYILRSSKPHLCFAFFLGGGLGNLIDRYLLGAVTDFIKPLFVDFAVFNIADICLNIGVGLLLLSMFGKENND